MAGEFYEITNPWDHPLGDHRQKVKVGASGSDSRRVLEALSPLKGNSYPPFNAEFIGQIYVETETPAVYIAVGLAHENPADDWQQLTPVAGIGD